eukprot:gene13483-19340_t
MRSLKDANPIFIGPEYDADQNASVIGTFSKRVSWQQSPMRPTPLCSQAGGFQNMARGSTWDQNADEVFIRVPVAESVHGKSVHSEVHPKRLSLHVDGNSMLEGSLEDVGGIKLDGCFWTMEDEGQARHVLVTLAKMNKGDQEWDGLLEEEAAVETITNKKGQKPKKRQKPRGGSGGRGFGREAHSEQGAILGGQDAYPNTPASHYQALVECAAYSDQQAVWKLALDLDDFEFTEKGRQWGRFWGSPELTRCDSCSRFLAANPKAGDVFSAPPSIYKGYSAPMRASFSNMSNSVIPLQLAPGDTHVAVGFVDLASLLTAELAAGDCPLGSSTSSSISQTAAKFVGFDGSAYTVAASLVVLCMVAMESVDIDSVIQVWGSSCWSGQALADFSRTIDMLMQLPKERSGPGSHEDQRARPSFLPAGFATTALTPEVLQVLLVWKAATLEPKSASDMQSLWHSEMDSERQAFRLPLSMQTPQDRVSFARYVLTGELPVGSKGTVGSILMLAGKPFKSFGQSEIEDLMWSIAGGGIHPVLPRPSEEIFHHLLPMYELILPKAGGGAGEARGALMDECVEFTCGALRKLRGWLVSERLSVSLTHATLRPEAAALLSSVQSMAPTSVSWSNILDYMPPANFHRMARLCSSPKAAPAKHYITTMNWIQSVYGLCPSELPVPERKTIYAAGIRRISQRLEVADPSGFLVRGYHECLHVSNAWEYEQSFSLAPSWVRHFCSQDGHPGRVSVHRLAKGTWGDFSRNASTVHLLLSYANEEAAEEKPLELPPWG